MELPKRQQELLELLKQDGRLTRSELAEKLGINPSAVQAHIKKLKDKNLLRRVNGTRGYWQVINQHPKE
jgi:ATP-dependent DNA helicase RecG